MNKSRLLKAYPELNQLDNDQLNSVSKMIVKDMNKNKRPIEFYDNLVKNTLKTMKGSGLKDIVIKGVKKISNIIAKTPINEKFNYKLKKGEFHTLLKAPNDGNLYYSRYAGPGTKVLENTAELKKKFGTVYAALKKAKEWSPDPAIDKAGMLHDSQYAVAGDMYFRGDKEGAKKYVEDADREFLGNLQDGSTINKLAPGTLIGAKKDLLSFKSFITTNKGLSDDEIKGFNEILKAFNKKVYVPIDQEAKETPKEVKEVPKEAHKEEVKEEVEEVKPVEQIQQGDGRKYRPLRFGRGLRQSKPVDRFSKENINREVNTQGNNLSDAEILKFIRDLKKIALDIDPVESRKPIYDRIIAFENFLEKRQGGGCRQCGGMDQQPGVAALQAQINAARQQQNLLITQLENLIGVPRDQWNPWLMDAHRHGQANELINEINDSSYHIRDLIRRMHELQSHVAVAA